MTDSNSSATGLVAIRGLQEPDLAGALELESRERWNQTLADWKRMLRLDPGGAFAALDGNSLVGTVTTTTYGSDLAWIGMMMVAAPWRGRGIGKRLMGAALGYCVARSVASVKLDATPAGRPLYESLGFVAEGSLERWQGTVQGGGEATAERFDASLLPQLRDFDRRAFGADRGELLGSLIAEAAVPPVVEVAAPGSLRGYALARQGTNATYVGPIVALDERDARRLLGRLLGRLCGPVCLDVPVRSGGLTDLLRERGFEMQRELTRMCRGTATAAGLSGSIYAIAGPESG